MSYLIVELTDRLKAEEAYLALEGESFPMDRIEILGRGYKTPEDVGLVDPVIKAKKRIRLTAFWLVPFGFVAGSGFSLATQLQTFAWAGGIGNHIVGGLMGAIGGAMGSFVIGGGQDLLLKNDDGDYNDRIATGKYLLTVNGTEMLINQVAMKIRQFNPEDMQVID